jgi:hypothetical protein
MAINDADLIIRGEKGAFDLAAWFASRSDDQYEIAAITVAELWHRVETATEAHKATRESYLRALLEVLPIHAYTETDCVSTRQNLGGTGNYSQDDWPL